MPVLHVERNKGYTVMFSCHLRDKPLSLKAKGPLRRFCPSRKIGTIPLRGCHRLKRILCTQKATDTIRRTKYGNKNSAGREAKK